MRSPRPAPLASPGERGFSLLEVLIALVVLSVGLLGLAMLQAMSLKQNHSAFLRSQANTMAYDILDRMLVNRSAVDTGAYVIALGTDPPTAATCVGSGVTCSAAQMAAYDLDEWKTRLASALPSGDGAIAVNGDTVTVTVEWNDSRGEENLQQFTTSTDL